MCSQLRYLQIKRNLVHYSRLLTWERIQMQTAKPVDIGSVNTTETASSDVAKDENVIGDMFPPSRVVPMVLSNKEPVVLSFDSVPGPKSLKYLSGFRHYLSEIGTQLTAGILTLSLNVGTYITDRKSIRNLSTLFDEYGPVVRFVSPMGGDIVLINHPDHIQKVYAMEGDTPVRSALDSLEKYRTEHRNHTYGGLFTVQGEEWTRQREMLYTPIHSAVEQHVQGIYEMCDKFTQKVYNLRNYQDELSKDLHKELHKWTFDCIGLLIFSKKFSMLDTELVYSQCDTSWMYHSLVKATDAIVRCESGLHLWKLFTTPAWFALIKHCDSLDSLIGKYVLEAEQELAARVKDEANGEAPTSIISSMLLSEQKMTTEDIATVLMDMLLIGVNTISTTMSFLMYYLAKYQKCQKMLYQEVGNIYPELIIDDVNKIKANTPYLQACIMETLRLVPPIPLLTRILPRNITLDRYNIPRGTLIMMSTQDASLKESNFEDAARFSPERWLAAAKQHHPFACVPFGHGARRCLGQSVAETMLTLLTIRVLQKYKLEYHYGDIHPTRSFIARPNKPLKIRFIDRI
ncbi:probable cytochrome P450 301a1, mitochondrial [Epargyreus clarus]|uniref:probable cytochrome P450 301a1, mitochondrial n=1 Tax=Epargyreus clarus TaxID=520877 RepID=UPI003C2C53B1